MIPATPDNISEEPAPIRTMGPRSTSEIVRTFPIAPLPPALSTSPNLFVLLQSLQRRWYKALCLGLFCSTFVAAAVWLLVPPSLYTARSLMHASSIPPKVIFQTAEVRADFPTFSKTQMTLIRSRLVLNTALRDPKVSSLELV